MSLTYEICIDSAQGAIAAERAGAQRVELCAALFEGGITPSLGMIRATLSAVSSIRVHVIIRPRAGDFIYDAYEVAAMEDDVAAAREAGAHGIVIGALTADGRIDRQITERLIRAADGLPITFHRAFDMTADPIAALDTLMDLGMERVLTSGQETTALEGAPLLAALIRRAGDRIVVMPGGGITDRNVGRVLAATGAKEIHFAALTEQAGPATYRNPRPRMGGQLSRPEYDRHVTSGHVITEIIAAAGSSAATGHRDVPGVGGP